MNTEVNFCQCEELYESFYALVDSFIYPPDLEECSI